MSLFDKTKDEIIKKIKEIDKAGQAELQEEWNRLKQESRDMSDLMGAYSLYVNARETFFFHPGEDTYANWKVHFEQVKKAIGKIDIETHNIEHLMDWLKGQVAYEEKLVHTIGVMGVKVR